jgi:hypothetical protein
MLKVEAILTQPVLRQTSWKIHSGGVQLKKNLFFTFFFAWLFLNLSYFLAGFKSLLGSDDFNFNFD